MAEYLFVFGRTPELSFLELSALYHNVERWTHEVASASFPDGFNPQGAITHLAGTVKIAQYLDSAISIDADTLIPYIPIQKNVTFGISAYGGIKIPIGLLRKIKEILTKSEKSISYVESKGKEYLDSVVIAKKHVFELLLIPAKKGIAIAKTLCTQPFEDWSLRDYGRPYVDPKRGMLPPKVARMVINITMGKANYGTILDPFCGSGTILGEALLSGFDVFGSDLSKEIVDKAEKNIDWLATRYPFIKNKSYKLLISDATGISDLIPKSSLDAIISEPFLGKADRNTSQIIIKNRIKGLTKLYIGCLRNWYSLLKNNGKVMIAVPQIVLGKREYSVKKPIDMCETLGYTKVLGPIEYAREGAIVKRQFYLFQKN